MTGLKFGRYIRHAVDGRCVLAYDFAVSGAESCRQRGIE